MKLSGQNIARLALLVVGAVLIQVAAISQITVLGASADISPLLVASIGLLTNAEFGAIMGFIVGLFVDMALIQTLGVSSLLYLTIGYGSGRYSEARDPTASLVPLAAGALATAVATVGYSVIQFMLGVDSPVSALLMRQIVVTIALNTLLAAPVFLLVRRVLRPALRNDVIPPRRRPSSGKRLLRI